MSLDYIYSTPTYGFDDTRLVERRVSRRHALRTALGAAASIGLGARGTASAVSAHTDVPSGVAHALHDNVVLRWNRAALDAVRAIRMPPPLVARALAVLHTCIYDAWAAYDERAISTRLGGSIRQPPAQRTLEHKNEAISYAAYRALVDLFPSQHDQLTALMTGMGYVPADTAAAVDTPHGIGNMVSQAMLADCHRDGSNQLGDLNPGAYTDYSGYAPVNTPDQVVDLSRWQPLRIEGGQTPIVQSYLAPHWGLVRPFALTSGSEFRPWLGPALWPSVRFEKQAQEVLALSAQLTDRQKMIAEYWADGPATETPPGHWNVLATFVSARDNHDLDTDVKLFFALNNALFDASIAAWDAKRAFDSVRPITAIRTLFAGQAVAAWGGPFQGTQMIDGATWRPYQPATFVTPPFPEFVSGHSTFSAAAAEVLRRFSGSDAFGMEVTLPVGSSKIEAGVVPALPVTLSWSTFSAAVEEAGLSRRYGGIHFEEADLAGQKLGRRVGGRVFNRAWALIEGTP